MTRVAGIHGLIAIAVGGTLMSLSVSAQTAPTSGQQTTQAVNRFNGSIFAGAIYSDNETRVDGRAGTSVEAGLSLDIEQTAGRLFASIDGNIGLRDYQSGVLDRQAQGNLSSQLRYDFVTERISWVVEDYFGQSFIRQEVIDAPINRQYFNYVGTGPDFTIPLAARTSIDGQLRWTRAHYSESFDINSIRSEAQLSLRRQVSEAVAVAVGGSFQKVNYEEPTVGADFDIRTLDAEMSATGLKTELQLRGGSTRLKRGAVTTSEPLMDASLSRRFGERVTLGMHVGERVSDNTQSYVQEQSFSRVGIALIPDAVAAGAFRSSYADGVVTMLGLRNKLDLRYIWQRENYYDSTRADRQRTGPVLTLSRQLKPGVSFNIHGYHWQDKFMGVSSDSHESDIGAGVDWNLPHSSTLSIAVDRYRGDGVAPAGSGRISYGDNQIVVRLGRRLGK